MRHNQNNNRRFRNGQNRHHNNHGNNSQRRVNPRVQTFDSNGPDVRIRGNAIQITEKYMTLARDATAAGDRILAESYFQHAEHYQRMLNEANEEFARNNPQAAQQQQQQQQGQPNGEGEQPAVVATAGGEQPVVPLNDLDQGFLVGNNRQQQGQQQPAPAKEAETA